MQFTFFLPFLCAGFGFVWATDNRLLYKISAGESMDAFTADFETTCSTWPPAIAAGLTFGGYLVEPGDYRGNNADIEAKIVCGWNSGTSEVLFTADVAAALGATHVSS